MFNVLSRRVMTFTGTSVFLLFIATENSFGQSMIRDSSFARVDSLRMMNNKKQIPSVPVKNWSLRASEPNRGSVALISLLFRWV